jgi:hypothetical protein
LMLAMMSMANTAEAQRMIRGSAPVIVSPVGVANCRVRIHRGRHHHRAIVYARPLAIRSMRMHRNRW